MDLLSIAPDQPSAMMRVTAEAISPGAPARIPHPIIRALQATPAEQAIRGEAMLVAAAMLAAVAMEAAEAISAPPASRAFLTGQTIARDI
jgi:hypothetical protein